MYIVYSKPNCHQCEQAITQLRNSGEEHTVKKIGMGVTMQEVFDMIAKSNKPEFAPRSAPVIFKEESDGSLIVFESYIEFSNQFLDI